MMGQIAENFKNTVRGIRISFKTAPIYTKAGLITTLFGLIFASELPGMVQLEKIFSLLSSDNYKVKDVVLNTLLYFIIFTITGLIIIYVSKMLAEGVFNAFYTIRENAVTGVFKMKPGMTGLSMGEIINSIKTDTQTLVSPFDHLIDVPGRLIYGLGAFVLIFITDRAIALALILPVISVIFLTSWFSTGFRKYNKISRKAAAKVSGHLGDIVSNVQTIKVMGARDNMAQKLVELGDIRRNSTVKTMIIRQIMWNITTLVNGVIMFIVLIMSASRLKSGAMSIGDFFIFTYFPRTLVLVLVIGRLTSLSQSAVVSYERLEKLNGKEGAEKLFTQRLIMTPEAEEVPVPEEKGKTLKVLNLSSTFNGDNGVKDISLTVNEGEFLAVTGRIGSGKSVLLKTITGNKGADEGKILYGDEDITDKGLIPPFGSLTPQSPNLFSMTLKENIILGREYDEEKFMDAVITAELTEDLERLSDGADTLIGSKGVKLSGGQKQRVAVARMIYHDSEVFLLDDVSSALDVVTEGKLWENLKKKNRTRIAVTTRRAALKNADRILVLKDGRCESLGTFGELMESSNEFKKIWGNVD